MTLTIFLSQRSYWGRQPNHIDGHTTKRYSAYIGVKQVYVLKLFINDIPSMFDDSCDPVSIYEETLTCFVYADDIVLLSHLIRVCRFLLIIYVPTWWSGSLIQIKLKHFKYEFSGKKWRKHINMYFNIWRKYLSSY